MRMANHRERTVTRHEWSMDASEGHITARDLGDLIHQAQNAMARLGVDVTHDNSYYVQPRDDELVIWVETTS